jgi:hypothetical protein
MIDATGDRLINARDCALLAFGMASAMRRSKLAVLDVADLTEQPDGLHVLIRRSKTDQEGRRQVIAVPRGAKLRPVELLQTWLARAEISAGPVYRQVALGGKVSAEPLSDGARYEPGPEAMPAEGSGIEAEPLGVLLHHAGDGVGRCDDRK